MKNLWIVDEIFFLLYDSKFKNQNFFSDYPMALIALDRSGTGGRLVKVGDAMLLFVSVSIRRDCFCRRTSKGKVVLVNFFATWCPPCQKELAAVQETLWPKYKDNDQFALVVVGREHDEVELAKYNEKKGFTFPLYPDKNRSIYAAFAQSLIPRSYLFDKEGKVIRPQRLY